MYTDYSDQSEILALNVSNNSCRWQKILSQLYECECLYKWTFQKYRLHLRLKGIANSHELSFDYALCSLYDSQFICL